MSVGRTESAGTLGGGLLPAPTSGARTREVGQHAAGRRRKAGLLLLGSAVLVLLVGMSVSIGSATLGTLDALAAIGFGLLGLRPDWVSPTDFTVVWQLRLPRAALALVAGASLSASGVLLQGLLRNPLVSPFTLGISPAAAFGASVAILFLGGVGATPLIVIILSALASALLCAGAVLGIAASRRMAPIVVILIGVALTQFFEALTAAMQFVADEATLQSIVRWTFGSINAAEWSQVGVIGLVLLAVLPVAMLKASELNAIAFAGDEAARSLGVNVPVVRTLLAGIAVLLAAIVVAFTGVIGFVSLVAPHIARLIIGSDHRLLLPFSLITGGALILAADIVGRVIIAPVVVPVGIVIAFIGAPLFINLILTRRHTLT